MIKFLESRVLWVICGILFLPCLAHGRDLHISVEFARQDYGLVARILYSIPDGYHAYGNQSSSTGKPTHLNFTVEGSPPMPVIYPSGIQAADIFEPDKKIRVYEGETVLFVPLPTDSEGKLYEGDLSMLLCSRKHCMPVNQRFSGEIPVQISLMRDKGWLAHMQEVEPGHSDEYGRLRIEKGTMLPNREDEQEDDRERKLAEPKATRVEQAEASYLESRAGTNGLPRLMPKFANEGAEIYSLWQAVIFGIMAGLILNVMPCVLPVLTMKVGSFMAMGQTGALEHIKSFRFQNLSFAGGVLAFFTALALMLGAADGIWGQLYQNHALLLGMSLFVFLMGLSMTGVFTLPSLDIRLGANVAHPYLRSFITGTLSTFLATPCSGPLLGGVLAWAFTQSLFFMMLAFWSVGFGMSLPYLVLCCWPGVARLLPRPGKWMLIFERILGFLLIATAIYLVSILPESKYLRIMILFLVASFFAWIWGCFCDLRLSGIRNGLIACASCAIIIATSWWVILPQISQTEWNSFSTELFRKELGKENLLVEFTADWCPNCKYLEATVLTPANLEAWRKKYSLRLIRADLTNSNPAAEELLEMLGSRSIPLTALFSKGDSALSPLVLRDLYREETLKNALQSVFGKWESETISNQNDEEML